MLSETIVWCAFGRDGLNNYRDRRLEANGVNPGLIRGGYGRCFHDGSEVLRVVHATHMKALHEARGDPDKQGLLREMVRFAEMMLEDSVSRPPDVVVYKGFAGAIQSARNYVNNRTTASEHETVAVNIVPTLFQTMDPSRTLPPDLPPELLVSGTQFARSSEQSTTQAPIDNQDDEIFVLPRQDVEMNGVGHASSSQGGILRHIGQNCHAVDEKLLKRRVTFQVGEEDKPKAPANKPTIIPDQQLR